MEILEPMKKKIMVIGILILTTAIAPIAALGQGLKPASESERTLLNKSEIIELMIQAGKMPGQQQAEKIDQLWAAGDNSKTPRSDFLYCTAFAYLDNYKAQACLGRAYENGNGIVSNLPDAYVWYSVALDHPIDDANVKDTIQTGRDHVAQMMHSVYPAPSDYELEDLVKKQKEKIVEYAAEAGKAGR
jgi:TPR repeat protein